MFNYFTTTRVKPLFLVLLGILAFQYTHGASDLEVSLSVDESFCGADESNRIRARIQNNSVCSVDNITWALYVNGEIYETWFSDYLDGLNPAFSDYQPSLNKYVTLEFDLGMYDLHLEILDYIGIEEDENLEDNSASVSFEILELCDNTEPTISTFPYQELICEEELDANELYSVTVNSEHDDENYELHYIQVDGFNLDSIVTVNQDGLFDPITAKSFFKVVSTKKSENITITAGMTLDEIQGCCTKISDFESMHPLEFRMADWEISYSCISDEFMHISIKFLPGFYQPNDLDQNQLLLEGSLAELLEVDSYSTSLLNKVIPFTEGTFDLVATGEHNGCGIPISVTFNDCQQALEGTYSVGGAGADFADLEEVNDALYQYGQKGAIRLEINEGSYDSGLVATSATMVTKQYPIALIGPDWSNESAPLVELNVAEGMQFDEGIHFENLTINNQNGILLNITDAINSVGFIGCVFHQEDNDSPIINAENANSPFTVQELKIDNCQFSGGSVQVKVRAIEINMEGSQFSDFAEAGISTTSGTNYSLPNGFTKIYRCELHTEQNAETGIKATGDLLRIGYTSVTGNMVDGMHLFATGCAQDDDVFFCAGELIVSTCTVSVPNIPIVAQNIISSNIYSSSLLSREGGICVDAKSSSNNLTIENSILATYGSEGAEGENFSWINDFSVWGDEGEYGIISCNQYSAGAADSSTALNCNPLFNSDLDLHVNNTLLFDAGTPSTNWATGWDIDGDLRDDSPTIGADEVNNNSAPTLDIEFVEFIGWEDSEDFALIITNNGEISITSFEGTFYTGWWNNFSEAHPFSVSDINIAPGDTLEITVPVMNWGFWSWGEGLFLAIDLPNGMVDGVPFNNFSNMIQFNFGSQESIEGSVEIVSVDAPEVSVTPGDVPFEITISNNGSSTVEELQIDWWINSQQQNELVLDDLSLEPGESITIDIGPIDIAELGDYTATFWIPQVNNIDNQESEFEVAYYDFTVASAGAAIDVLANFFINPEQQIATGEKTVSVQFSNNGPSDLNHLELQWSVNGIEQPTVYFYNENLASGENREFILGEYDFDNAGLYELIFTAVSPNGQSDLDDSNNSTATTIEVLSPENYPCNNDNWQWLVVCDLITDTYTISLEAVAVFGNNYQLINNSNDEEFALSEFPLVLGPFDENVYPSYTISNLDFSTCITTFELDESEEICCQEMDWYLDADGDGLGDSQSIMESCEQPEGYVLNNEDDDDTCPGATDECGVCEGPGIAAGFCDCDGLVPETIWYIDTDGDGLGSSEDPISACEQPQGYVDNSDDDDDLCASERDECGICEGPGIPAGFCDCDATMMETIWYADSDMDGLGDPDNTLGSCDEQPDGYVANGNDNNDNMASGIDAEVRILSASIYPNPANEFVHIEFEAQSVEMILEIHDLKGKLIRQQKLSSGLSKVDLSIIDWPSGMYLLQMRSPKTNKLFFGKILVE